MKFTVSLLAVVGIAQASWKSGSVSTYEKFTYGKFVTRMRAPDKKGTVSSFFTYWDGPGFYPGGWNELDIEIVPSVESNPFSMNIIYGDGHNKLESHDYAPNYNPGNEWHEYVMEWTPDYISWSVDGREVRHVPGDDPAVQFMNKQQSLRMNFWTPTFHSWGEGFDPADMPWYVLYDYVEVFTYNEHNNEFDFHWRDDFNAFDSGRWHKASGGFEANSSVFYPSNVYTSAGNLVLKMEPMDHHAHEHSHPDEHDTHYDLHLHGDAHRAAHHGERYHPTIDHHDVHQYGPGAHHSIDHTLVVGAAQDQWEHKELYHAHDAAHDLHHDGHDVAKHELHIPQHQGYYSHGHFSNYNSQGHADAIDEKVVEDTKKADEAKQQTPKTVHRAVFHGHSDEHSKDTDDKTKTTKPSLHAGSYHDSVEHDAHHDTHLTHETHASHDLHGVHDVHAVHEVHDTHDSHDLHDGHELGSEWETHHHRRVHEDSHGRRHADAHSYHHGGHHGYYDDDHEGDDYDAHHSHSYHEVHHHSQPIVVHPHEDVHHDVDYHIHHDTHPELSHEYDQRHDVTPFPYHEHDIYHKADPESYLERTWAVDEDTHYPHGHWSDADETHTAHHSDAHHTDAHHADAHHSDLHHTDIHHSPVHHSTGHHSYAHHPVVSHH